MYPMNRYEDYDFHFYQGEDAVINICVTEADGSAKVLSGATAYIRIGSVRGNTTAIEITATIVEADGMFYIRGLLSDTETAALSAGMYNYQTVATDNSDDTQFVKNGFCQVRARLPAA